MTNSLREKIFKYVKEKYQSEIEYPWIRFPNYCVFRHNDNKKWFGLIMSIPYAKVGIKKDGVVDILNIKVHDLILKDMLIHQQGIYSAYHISKSSNWISVLLDKSVSLYQIFNLIDESYFSTSSKLRRKNER